MRQISLCFPSDYANAYDYEDYRENSAYSHVRVDAFRVLIEHCVFGSFREVG
jgi:hypothetical protein